MSYRKVIWFCPSLKNWNLILKSSKKKFRLELKKLIYLFIMLYKKVRIV